MNPVKDLESKIFECVKHASEFVDDYTKLVIEVRELKKTVEKLESEKREFRQRIDSVAERVETHLKVRS